MHELSETDLESVAGGFGKKEILGIGLTSIVLLSSIPLANFLLNKDQKTSNEVGMPSSTVVRENGTQNAKNIKDEHKAEESETTSASRDFDAESLFKAIKAYQSGSKGVVRKNNVPEIRKSLPSSESSVSYRSDKDDTDLFKNMLGKKDDHDNSDNDDKKKPSKSVMRQEKKNVDKKIADVQELLKMDQSGVKVQDEETIKQQSLLKKPEIKVQQLDVRVPEARVNTAEQERDEAKEAQRQAEHDLAEANAKVSDLEKKLAQMEVKAKEAASVKTTASDDEIEKLRAQVRDLKGQWSEENKRKVELQQELTQLQKTTDEAAKANASEIEELKSKNAKSEQQLSEVKEQLKSVAQENVTLQGEQKATHMKLEKASSDNKQLQEKLAFADMAYKSELQKQASEKDEKIDQLQRQLEEARKQAETAQAAVRQRAEELQRANDELRKQLDEVTRRANTAQEVVRQQAEQESDAKATVSTVNLEPAVPAKMDKEARFDDLIANFFEKNQLPPCTKGNIEVLFDQITLGKILRSLQDFQGEINDGALNGLGGYIFGLNEAGIEEKELEGWQKIKEWLTGKGYKLKSATTS